MIFIKTVECVMFGFGLVVLLPICSRDSLALFTTIKLNKGYGFLYSLIHLQFTMYLLNLFIHVSLSVMYISAKRTARIAMTAYFAYQMFRHA